MHPTNPLQTHYFISLSSKKYAREAMRLVLQGTGARTLGHAVRAQSWLDIAGKASTGFSASSHLLKSCCDTGVGGFLGISDDSRCCGGRTIHARNVCGLRVSMREEDTTQDNQRDGGGAVDHGMALIAHPDGSYERCKVRSGAWLASMKRGAYTTARTVGGNCVFELSFHLQRIIDSLEIMEESLGAKAGFDDAAVEHGTALELKNVVMSSMREAVLEFSKTCSGELKITVLVVMEEGLPRVWTHVTSLGPQAAHPIKVIIHGHPRDNAEAKDSEWVRERRSLEKTMPSDVNEIVLIGEDGDLFEGLSSNFFVLQGGVLYTAGEGVLLGSVREAVLRSAERLDIPVVLKPPNVKDMGVWDAAFVSSTSRKLLHIDALTLRDDAGVETTRVFDKAALAQRLEHETEKEIVSCSELLLF
ncbi:hypothetical protein PSENEW3_00000123 [Picochlorum sp. SENEW3]|nr:hypothetical protein PSENEW3_00000123 [Picochlorum sp. SENEW3]